MREKLIELFKQEYERCQNTPCDECKYDNADDCGVDALVDHLIANDVVPVVRCKDCKSHHWEQEPCHGKTVHICRKLNAEVTRDFYCAAGERKDNE